MSFRLPIPPNDCLVLDRCAAYPILASLRPPFSSTLRFTFPVSVFNGAPRTVPSVNEAG